MTKVGERRQATTVRGYWPRRRKLLLPIAAVLAGAIGLSCVIASRRTHEPLASFADRAFAALDEGDGRALAAMMYPPERAATGLNADRATRLVRWFHDAMKGFRIEDKAQRGDKARDSVVSAERDYRADDGRETTLSLYIVRDERGPHLFLTHSLVTCAFLARYKAGFRDEPDRVAHWEAIREGVDRERSVLEAIPLAGVAGTDAEATFYSWSSFARFAATTAASQRDRLRTVRAESSDD